MTRNIVATGVIAFAAALGACAGNGDEVLLILNNVVPGDGCVLSAEEEGVFRSAGVLDTAGGEGYLLTPLLKNTATTEAATEAQRTVFISGARIDLTFPDPSPFDAEELANLADSGLTRFEVPQSGAVSPNGGTATLGFAIMQPPLVAALNDELDGIDDRILVQAEVTMRGTMGGGTIESQTFTFPITLCEGCNIIDVGPCAMLGDGEPLVSNPCNPFQDGQTECCSDTAGLVCPARRTGS